MSGAYLINGQRVAPEAFYAVACDPRRSVVVEACAGAGKTWMLVSRMLRAMMDGTPPHQILAITFTRKAAGEMRTRLQEWMHEFAHADDAACDQALRDRGVAAADLPVLRERLRGLQAAWMADGRSVEIHTILGWFAKLVQGAPLDLLHELGLPPDMQLIEDTQALWPTVWGRFLRLVDRDEALKGALADSVRDVGRHNTEAWLQAALSSRLEIELAERAGTLCTSVEGVSALNKGWADDEDLAAAWRQPVPKAQLWALAKELGQSTKKGQRDAAVALETALGQLSDEAAEQGIRQALFTSTGGLRKALGESDLVMWAAAWLGDWADARAQARARQQHERQCLLAKALLEAYRQLKSEMGVADMVDLELAAGRLMADPVMSGWVQERLDHQVRHVLMDEFQDTSPLQWHTLRAWLSAYAGAGGGSSGQQAPSVFLVGDPKQSIYRFRRADPRVFQAARRFVVEGLDGQHLACDHTRRNAQGVIAALNAVMGQVAAAGRFPDFRMHTSASAEAGQLRVLPQVPREATAQGDATQADAAGSTRGVHTANDASSLPPGWRDTLTTPRHEIEPTRREQEAEQIATLVAHTIAEEGVPADRIFVLARRRVTLDAVAQALAARQIAHIAPESDLLTDKAEVQDLMAAVEALLSPGNKLALAHALRSPLFGVDDDGLQWLAMQLTTPQMSWMNALLKLGPTDQPPASLLRAQRAFTAWQQALPQLPPHDLLERIVRDTGYRQALAAHVPHGQWQAALFNVDTLLAHALGAQAGRDLTPYAWLRQLRREPPKLPPRAAGQAVQLLTVHGAKGLEADVVVLADMDPEPQRSGTYSLMVDWPEGQSAPVRCAFVASERQCPPSLRPLRDAEDLADEIEGMNALYVAITRARRTLVLSSTAPRSSRDDSWWAWMHRASELPPPLSIDDLAVSVPPAHMALTAAGPDIQVPGLPDLPGRPPAAALAGEGLPEPAASGPSPRPPANRDAVLGQWVHAALEQLTLLPGAQRSDARIAQVLQATQAALAAQLALPAHTTWPDLQPTAAELSRHMLDAPALRPWLRAEGWAWVGNEVPMSDAAGVMRLDRLVAERVDDGRLRWWVIDYKLNHDPMASEAYQAQMARYVAAVQALQPQDAVGGAFITAQGEWVVWRAPPA